MTEPTMATVSKKRKAYLATSLSSAMVMALAAYPAVSQDVTIEDTRKEAIKTSTADGTNPGNITVASGGEIVLKDPGVMVTVDSNNSFTNDGVMENFSDQGVTAILIDTSNSSITGDVTNNNLIQLGPDRNDTDATGANFGIVLSGGNGFTGNITLGSGSTLAVKGIDGVGIKIDDVMTGDIISAGSILMQGENSVGLALNSTLNGSIINNRVINVNAENSVGIHVNGYMSGSLINRGNIVTGGQAFFNRKRELQQGFVSKAGIIVRNDIAGGILNLKGELEDIGNFAGTITSRGDGPAIWITTEQVDGSFRNITIGNAHVVDTSADDIENAEKPTPNLTGYSLINEGTITGQGGFNGVDANGIRLEGSNIEGQVSSISLTGGIFNTGEINVQATDGDTLGLYIGDNVSVPSFTSTGSMIITSSRASLDENFDGKIEGFGPGGNATAIHVNETGSLASFRNEGVIQVVASGENNNAYGVRDLSGTLTSVYNEGTISVRTQQEGGVALAFDLSNAQSDITFTNKGGIVGDVLLNTGNQTVTFDGGAMLGDINYAGSTGSMSIVNGSDYRGALLNAQNINLSLDTSALDLRATETPTTVASFTATNASQIKVRLDPSGGKLGGLNVTGTASLSGDTKLETVFDSFGFENETYEILNAGNLDIVGGASSIVNVAETYLFESRFFGTDGANGKLLLSVRRKDADELGLTGNRAAIYEGSVQALRADAEFGAALANIQTGDEFADVLNQMMPQPLTGTTREIASSLSTFSHGAMRDRLGTIRQLNAGLLVEGKAGTVVTESGGVINLEDNGIWGQQFFYEFNRKADGQFSSHGGDTFGIALGYDRALFGLDAVGVSLVHGISSFQDDGRFDDNLLAFSTLLSTYASYNNGGFFTDMSVGFGFNAYDSERRVVVGELVRTPEASWTGTQLTSHITSGYRLAITKNFGWTLFGNANYTTLNEKSFNEVGGGEGVNMRMDKRTSNSMKLHAGSRLDAVVQGAEFNMMFSLEGGASQQLKDEAQTFNTGFVASDVTFGLVSPTLEKRSYNVGGGIAMIMGTAVASLKATKEWSTLTDSFNVSATVRFRF